VTESGPIVYRFKHGILTKVEVSVQLTFLAALVNANIIYFLLNMVS
jgi:hypothetical protein